MFDFSCSECGSPYHAEESHEGKRIRCTACGAIVVISRKRQTINFKNVEPLNAAKPVDAADPEKTSSRSSAGWNGSSRLRWSHKPILISGSAIIILGSAVILAIALFLGGFLMGRRPSSGSLSAPKERAVVLAPTGSSSEVAEPAVTVSSAGDNAPKSFQPILKNSAPDGNQVYYRVSPSANSLPSGTRIMPDEANSGHGELEASNGTNRDACLIVVSSATHQRVRKVYIKAQDTYTLDHLDPGDYTIVFATGIDWNNNAERFNRFASYFQFGRSLAFEESREANRLRYERHTITLNTVAGGNIEARPLSEAEFHALSGAN